jgi:dinuclear metal center YbgI/SA1388 family protein
MKISDITLFLESLAPPAFQEDYDNCGLLLGSADADCSGVLISLDTTETVIEEAAEKECNLVVSHHPLIFRGIKRIGPETGAGRTIISAIKKNIGVYAIHTNLDNVLPGVNSEIARRLGLENLRFLLPKRVRDTEENTENSQTDSQENRTGRTAGSGLVGELPEPVEEQEFLRLLKQRFRIPLIRHTALSGRPVRRVAVCGGAGSFLITSALSIGADFFITADIRYHEFFEAEGKLVMADIGHYESEQYTTDLLFDAILKKFPNFAVLKAGTATNPVHYYK